MKKDNFTERWKQGIEMITGLQQARITMYSMIPIFIGIVWGIVACIIGKNYWLTLILAASFPISLMQLLSTWQRYRKLKIVDDTFKKLNKK